VTIDPSWVSELHVPPSVSGEPQVPPLDPLEEPLDEPPDEDPDPEAPLELDELLEPDEPLAPDDAPELLEDDEASSPDPPPSPAGAPEPELELHPNDAPAPSATSATHHPATGNALDIVMSFRRARLARGTSVLWYQAPGGLVDEFAHAQWCTCPCLSFCPRCPRPIALAAPRRDA
jgi:hypothetical protein